jgi:hypothetical protein
MSLVCRPRAGKGTSTVHCPNDPRLEKFHRPGRGERRGKRFGKGSFKDPLKEGFHVAEVVCEVTAAANLLWGEDLLNFCILAG